MRWLLALMMVVLSGVAAMPRGQETGVVGGVVITDDGRPLPNAAVGVAGTRLGALTDADGRFLITEVPTGTRILRATSRGYREANRRVLVVPNDTTLAGFRLESMPPGVRIWLIDPAATPTEEDR